MKRSNIPAPNTNIATAQLGAVVISGESPNVLLSEAGGRILSATIV